MEGATVELNSITSKTSASRATDTSGRFQFTGLSKDSFDVTITSIGFATVTRLVVLDTVSMSIQVDLSKEAGVLAEVTVTATISPATQKGDTLQLNASQFKVNPDATVEDLARKMPGITIENGQVKAQGENVQKVTLDGRDFFGDDATAALRNLPAEIVDKIQVFDRLSEQAQFTGVDDGSTTKSINIVTKANMRNGQFGRVFAGYGTDDRYAAGGNTTILNGNRRISIVGNFNNVNQQNFSQQDLLGVTSTSQRGGGGQGGRGGQRGGGGGNRGSGGGGGQQGGGGFGNASSFLVGQQNGINKTNSVGLNYSDNWGSKATVSASYFFNNTGNTTFESINRRYFLAGIPNYNQVTSAGSTNNNHRFNMRLEYKFDSANSLLLIPSLNFQHNTSNGDINTAFISDSSASILSRTRNLTNSTRNGNNLTNTLLYRHSFPKKGRTLSLNINTSSNRRTGDVYTSVYDTTFNGVAFDDSSSQRFTDQLTNGWQVASNLIYTEPVGKNSQLQFNYNPIWSKSKADQQAYELDTTLNKYSVFSPNLSSKFDNTYNAQSGGAGYRYGTKDNQFNIGVNYQRSTLHSDQDFPRTLTVDKSFTNLLPNAMARLKLSTKSNLRIMYRASTSQPSVSQLQDVYDVTNAPFITAGNPNLEQQYMHTLSTRYTYTNTSKGLLLMGNVFFQTAANYITNATYVPAHDSTLAPGIVLQSGQQLTKPANLDGYRSIRSFLTFATPLKFIKSQFNINGGFTYSRLPGIINNAENVSNSYTYTTGAVIASNISPNVDFTVSYSANFNTVRNQLQPSLNNNYFSHVASVQLNLLSKSGWFLQNDLNNQLYSGLSAGYNQSYWLWNMAAGKKFLKDNRGELKVSVFDLLKQNQSITRNVTETYIEDQQNQVLQRYFMLTFTYNLRNFGAPAPEVNKNRRAAF